ncbi:MAG: hypothetical protein NTX45_16320 [Proteobacteria bacterium]|nr:hypothetical protein [Pseudomonadota bacterium]
MKKRNLLDRLRAKKQAKSSTVVGLTWYTEEQWERVKATAVDPGRFESTYVEWQAMAINALAEIQKTGMNVVKFFVIPDELQSWCLLHDKPNSATSRAEFVSEKMQQMPNP